MAEKIERKRRHSSATFNCCGCNERSQSDPRNRGRQQYCSKPDCRQKSKKASQAKWLRKPENQDHYKGSAHVQRVQQWREDNPDWRQKKRQKQKPAAEDSLQETSTSQSAENQGDAELKDVLLARDGPVLQDICWSQLPVVVGLVAHMNGVLQETIAPTLRQLDALGREHLEKLSGYNRTINKGFHHGENHTTTRSDSGVSTSFRVDRPTPTQPP